LITHEVAETDGIKYVRYTGMNNISAFFSTRTGGVSKPPYDSLNLGLHTGDDEAAAIENREKIGQLLQMPLNDWVTAQQIHGSNIAVVNRQDRGRGSKDFATALPDTDGMLTADTGVPLVTFYADCVPIFLADETLGLVGLTHAGWKGTVLRIAAAAVARMGTEYGSKVSDIKAVIGPSIGPCCYQVGQPVISRFRACFPNRTDILVPQNREHTLLDLWSANRLVLQEAGLKRENIYTTGLCTCCHEALFFSYRRDKGKTGRMAAFIMLNGNKQ